MSKNKSNLVIHLQGALMTGDLDKKIYVLDTNVLLFDAHSIYRFDLNDVMIPITVIEEIDRFKKDLNDLGRNARLFSRLMDQLRKQGSLAEGVLLPSGGRLWVGFPLEDSEHIQGLSTSNDNRILMMTKKLSRGYKKGQVVLVTKDTNMRMLLHDYDKIRTKQLDNWQDYLQKDEIDFIEAHPQGWLDKYKEAWHLIKA